MYKTIILDRDGVINHVQPDYVKTCDELVLIDKSTQAINKLLEKYEVVVASNQSGVGRKIFNETALQKIDEKINQYLCRKIKFFYCLHAPDEQCECRKPAPGLLKEIKRRYPAPFLFIGDSTTDYEASIKAEIDFCFVKTGYGELSHDKLHKPCALFNDLFDASKYLMKDL